MLSNSQHIFIALSITVALFISSGSSELIVHAPSDIAGEYTAYPIIYRNNFRNETIDGQIVLPNATDVTDKIVLMVYYRATYLTQIRAQQNRGARAVIISAQPGVTPGQANYVLDGSNEDDVKLSAWHITFADYNKLTNVIAKQPDLVVNATLNTIGTNPWKYWNDSFMVFVQVLLTAFSGANLGLAIYRLVSHIRVDGCRKRLPQACLELIIVGNIFRLLYVAVDPIWSRGVYPLPLQHVLWTFSHPFSLAVTILITFYWHDVMHGMSLNINQMLGRFKIPFIVVIVILFGIEIGFGIARALITVTGVLVTTMITANSSIYGGVCFAFAIFFFVTAGKLMKVLNKKQDKSKRGKTLARMTTRIIVIGACLIFHVILFILIANTSFSVNPIPFGTIWFFSYLVLCVQDLFQILALVPKPNKNSSTNKSSNKESLNMTQSTTQTITDATTAV